MEKKNEMRVPKRALVFGGSGQLAGKEITIRANSGKPFKHFFWNKLALDLSGMEIPKSTLPILMAHNLDRPIGSFAREDVVVNDDGLTIHGKLADVQAAREFTEQASAGIPFEASLYSVPSRIEQIEENAEVEVNGFSFEGPGSIFRQWQLKEVSPAIFGMDDNTETSVFAFAGSEEMVGVDLDGLSEDDRLANELFAAANGGPSEIDNTSAEDAALADEIFKAAGGQV